MLLCYMYFNFQIRTIRSRYYHGPSNLLVYLLSFIIAHELSTLDVFITTIVFIIMYLLYTTYSCMFPITYFEYFRRR